MAERFRGQFDQKVDAKGRMSIPARFRRVLEAEDPDHSATSGAILIFRYGYDLGTFAEVFHVNAMNEIDDRIDAMDFDDNREFMEDNYRERILPLEVDNDGRIVIPKVLRDRFALEGDVTLSGRGDHFRIAPSSAVTSRQEELKSKVLRDKGPNYDPRALLPKKPPTEDA